MIPANRRVSLLCVVVVVGATWLPVGAEIREAQTGAFVVERTLELPGTPEVIYDAITGDISGWWDHSFAENPARLYIEAKPGGGFYEIFDESGDGVKHAEVIFAQRGKLLRFEGPLGFSGKALLLVVTYAFEPVGDDATRLTVSAHGAGEMEPGWAEAIDSVWHHFMIERFLPYVEAGKHLE